MWLKSSMDESSWMIILVLTMANYVVSQTVTCGTAVDNQQLKCQFISANNIEWYKNGIRLTECAPSLCIPNTVGDQTFTASGGEYEIVIGAFNDSFCDLYSCRDTVTLASDSFPNCPEPPDTTTTTSTTPSTTTTTTSTTTPTTTTSTTTTTPTTHSTATSTSTTSTSTTTSASTEGHSGDSNLAANIIAPAVVGGVLLVTAITLGIAVCVCRRAKQNKSTGNEKPESGTSPYRGRTHPNQAVPTPHPGYSPAYITSSSTQPLGLTSMAYAQDRNRYAHYSYPGYSYGGHGGRTVYEAQEIPRVKHSRHSHGHHSGYTYYSYRM